MFDHETIVKKNGARLIGFGRYAGLVGAYNAFRGLGLRDDLFSLPKVETLPDLDAVKAQLDKNYLAKWPQDHLIGDRESRQRSQRDSRSSCH